MKNIINTLFFLFICSLGSCNNEDLDTPILESIYPITIYQTVGFYSPNNRLKLNVDEDDNPEFEFEGFFYGSMGGSRSTLNLTILNPDWNIKGVEKNHLICQDTLNSMGVEYYEQYSCSEQSNFISTGTYEVVNLFQESELLSYQNFLELNSEDGEILIFSNDGVGPDPFDIHPGDTFFNFTHSCCAKDEEGYFILEGNGKVLKLKIKFDLNGIYLKEVDLISN